MDGSAANKGQIAALQDHHSNNSNSRNKKHMNHLTLTYARFLWFPSEKARNTQRTGALDEIRWKTEQRIKGTVTQKSIEDVIRWMTFFPRMKLD